MATSTKQYTNIVISSLRGGMNDTDPAPTLPEDQCVNATNVEFFFSSLGERRSGCAAMSITGSGLEDEHVVVHLSQRFPTNDPTIGELWSVAATEGVSTSVARRSNEEEWFPIVPVHAIDPTIPYIYQINAQAFNSKMFFAYKAQDGTDRTFVWDGTTLRATGLSEPAAPPTAVDEGSGSYSGIRYFRVRYTTTNGSEILLRSEPSDSLTFTPTGSGAGATITRPALIGEAETNWELEASADNANFYIIASLPIATITYTDTTASALSYADQGDLSEDIGEYLLQPNARFLLVDGDRLILAGHFTDPALQSTVWWGPVSANTGVGNDERLPLNSLAVEGDNTVTLDNYEGGAITGVSQTVNGSFYIFKWSHIYQATKTGSTPAYDFICLSKARGALPGSIVSGVDEYGRGCIYFLDPLIGPSRLGPNGLQAIIGLRKTWTRINRLATGIVSHGVYYPEKYQMHWWVSADSANYPNLKLVLQVNQNQEDGDNNVIRGWSLATGRIAQAYCSAIVNVEVLDAEGDIATIARRPYIGLTATDPAEPDAVGGGLLQQCDLLSTDAGEPYMASITTKPYIMAGLLNKWGSMTAALLADESPTGTLKVSCVRDFGVETTSKETDLKSSPYGETLVLRKFDDLAMSDAYSVQFQFSDIDS